MNLYKSIELFSISSRKYYDDIHFCINACLVQAPGGKFGNNSGLGEGAIVHSKL